MGCVVNTGNAGLKRRVPEGSQVVSGRLPWIPGALSAPSYGIAITVGFRTCHLVLGGLTADKGKLWAMIAAQLSGTTTKHVSDNYQPPSNRTNSAIVNFSKC
jgi:hypothetical protein